MSSHYKEKPTLSNLIRRRGMTLTQWCRDFSVTSQEEAETVCKREGLVFDADLTMILAKEELRTIVDQLHTEAEQKTPQFEEPTWTSRVPGALPPRRGNKKRVEQESVDASVQTAQDNPVVTSEDVDSNKD